MNLNKEDIDALEDAAKKATPGPWCVQHPNAGVRGLEVADRTGLEQICADLTEPRAKYIAAANPAVVLALINKMRELEQKNLRLSSISADNHNKLRGWMDACLKAEDERDKLLPDANRYRWLRQQHWSGSPLCVVRNPKQALHIGSTCPSMELLDAAIDERMNE